MHPEAYEFVEQTFDTYGPWARVVEAGSLNVNGSVRAVFGDCDYVGIDRRKGPGVDVEADFLTWEGTADCLVSCEMLEHLGDLFGFVDAASRVVVPNGSLIITCATSPRPPHGVNGGPPDPGEFYGNVHPAHLRALLTSFGFRVRTQVVHEGRGDLYVYATKDAQWPTRSTS